MSDLDRQFDHLSLQTGQAGAVGANASHSGSAYPASPSAAPASPYRSLHSSAQQGYAPTSGFAGAGNPNEPQSASARFERFFANAGPEGTYPATNSTSPQAGPGSGFSNTSGAFGAFGHSLSGGGAGGSGRFGSQSAGRGSTGRSGLPAQWSSPDPALNAPAGVPLTPQSGGSAFLNSAPGFNVEEDIIPTAIVVKNIPFSVPKEQLLQIIEDLAIPMPYAFNYHFDGGMFRGLAFANFRSGEEADAVVAALNGFDVQGRKLRVEYKKVLQAGEKERIEKEKAIKRMQSMQLEKERTRHRDEREASQHGLPGLPAQGFESYAGAPSGISGLPQPSSGSIGRSTHLGGAGSNLTSPTTEVHPPTSAGGAGQVSPLPLTADSLRGIPSAGLGADTGALAPSERSGGASARTKEELDLNDPATLEIYSRVLLFKDDRMRDELSFSRNLSPSERRTVHLVAQRLGLYHYSMGEGEERYVIVTKNEVAQGHRPLRSQASTIGRTHRGGLGAPAGGFGDASGLLSPSGAATTGRAAALRAKKSAPDMKRLRDPENGSGYGGIGGGYGQGAGLAPPGVGALARKSNGNLREGYAATMGRSPRSNHSNQAGTIGSGTGGAAGLANLFNSPFDVPPVPSLPATSSGGHHGSGHASSPSGGFGGSIRQPRGPPTPGSHEAKNFAPRARVTLGASSGAQRIP
ncbi:mRNA cleavage and polyadenylation factor I complex, subunit RNA15 [Ceraceosorus bombacis]|uniref:mRNA cleavage and polyadenylation factor I complex, subunit RNA15 n=1 Tax=Ceraceosorus bombacis TaxID=401625 RepID=A0A0P1BHB1_9BASI|nr:mRNA cleavage and polyadenylation factor I complex, subunit RNA15 [Ceraceosorus bombacis]